MDDEFAAHAGGLELGQYHRIYGHPESSVNAGHRHQTVMTINKESVNALALPVKPPGGDYHDHVWHADIVEVFASNGLITSSVDNGHSHTVQVPVGTKLVGVRERLKGLRS